MSQPARKSGIAGLLLARKLGPGLLKGNLEIVRKA
jgi:hypothetical protein